MNRKSLKKLKMLIIGDIECCNKSIISMKGDQNPQVVKMYNDSISRLEALTDVLNYIDKPYQFQFNKVEVK